MSYPEHEKLATVAESSQAIGEFLEWADERGWHLAYYTDNPNRETEMAWIPYTVEKALALYFGIDLTKIEEEKRAMLEVMRDAQHA